MPQAGQTRIRNGQKQRWNASADPPHWVNVASSAPTSTPGATRPPAPPAPPPAPPPVDPIAQAQSVADAFMKGFNSGLPVNPQSPVQPYGYPSGVQVQPGLETVEELLTKAIQKYIADQQNAISKAQQEQSERAYQTQLAANPGDYVASELYTRELQNAGKTPIRPARSDVDIQNAYNTATGDLGAGAATYGQGRFGTQIYDPGEISRKKFLQITPNEKSLIGSFLSGGVNRGGTYTPINPDDYFREVQEGFIPTMQTGLLQRR